MPGILSKQSKEEMTSGTKLVEMVVYCPRKDQKGPWIPSPPLLCLHLPFGCFISHEHKFKSDRQCNFVSSNKYLIRSIVFPKCGFNALDLTVLLLAGFGFALCEMYAFVR